MNIHELSTFSLRDALQFHNELNPNLWDEHEQLLPEVREKLLAIAEDFQCYLGVDNLDLKDITLSGSNAAYSYTPFSDIDLHLVVTPPDSASDVYRELFDAKKHSYNNLHDIKIKGYPVELYVQLSDQKHISQGIYSVLNDQWVDVPKRKSLDADDVSVKNKYESLKHQIIDAIGSEDYAQLKQVQNRLKTLRQSGLEKNGEFGAENLAFKMLRARGWIDRLVTARNEAKDRELSLQERNREQKPVVYGFKTEDVTNTWDGVSDSTQDFLNEWEPEIDEDVTNTWDGVADSTQQFLNEKDPNTDVAEEVKDFIRFCRKELSIETMPRVVLKKDAEWSSENKTFGHYNPNDKQLVVNLVGRHPMDIMRTIAHELVHHRQYEKGTPPDNAGEDGSPYENQANSLAGVLTRRYAKLKPELFQMSVLAESIKVVELKTRAALKEYLLEQNKLDQHNAALSQRKWVDLIRESNDTDDYGAWLVETVQDHTYHGPLKIGDEICAASVEVIKHAKEAYFTGSNKPSAIVGFSLNKDGTLNYLRLADGNRYPRFEAASYKGNQLHHTLITTSPGEIDSVIMWAKLKKPEDWTLDVDLSYYSPLYEASGYIPTAAEANDPRFIMALSCDVHPGTLGEVANAFDLVTDSQGHPQIANPNGTFKTIMEEWRRFKEDSSIPYPHDVKPEEHEELIAAKEKTAKQLAPKVRKQAAISPEFQQAVENWVEMYDADNAARTILADPASKPFQKAPKVSKVFRALVPGNSDVNDIKSSGQVIAYSTSFSGAMAFIQTLEIMDPYVIVQKKFSPADCLLDYSRMVHKLTALGVVSDRGYVDEDEVWMKPTEYYTHFDAAEIVYRSEESMESKLTEEFKQFKEEDEQVPNQLIQLYDRMVKADHEANTWNVGQTKRKATLASKAWIKALNLAYGEDYNKGGQKVALAHKTQHGYDDLDDYLEGGMLDEAISKTGEYGKALSAIKSAMIETIKDLQQLVPEAEEGSPEMFARAEKSLEETVPEALSNAFQEPVKMTNDTRYNGYYDDKDIYLSTELTNALAKRMVRILQDLPQAQERTDDNSRMLINIAGVNDLPAVADEVWNTSPMTIKKVIETFIHELVHREQHKRIGKKNIEKGTNLPFQYKSILQKNQDEFYKAVDRLESEEDWRAYLSSPQEITAHAHDLANRIIQGALFNSQIEDVPSEDVPYVLKAMKSSLKSLKNYPVYQSYGNVMDPDNRAHQKVMNRFLKQVYQEVAAAINHIQNKYNETDTVTEHAVLAELTGVKKYHHLDSEEMMNQVAKDYGLEVLDSGAFGTVIQTRDPNVVVKVFERDDAYLRFLGFVRDHPNPHYPIVKNFPRLMTTFYKRYDIQPNKFVVVELEKLNELGGSLAHFCAEMKGQTLNAVPGYTPQARLNSKELTYEQFSEEYPWIPSLMEAMQELTSWNLGNDMHYGNFMQRSDGTIVIIDPVKDEWNSTREVRSRLSRNEPLNVQGPHYNQTQLEEIESVTEAQTVKQLTPPIKLWKAHVKLKQPHYVGYVDATVTAPDVRTARNMLKSLYGVQEHEVGSVTLVKGM